MVPQLLQYDISRPALKYNYQDAQLNYNKPKATATYSFTDSQVKYNMDRVEFSADFTAVKDSLGMKSIGKLTQENEDKAFQQIEQNVKNTVESGNNKANPKGMSIGQFEANEWRNSLQRQTAIGFVPADMAKVSFTKPNFTIDATKPEFSAEFNTSIFNKNDYSRGSFSADLVTKGSVAFTYIGNPNYFPRSATPLVNIKV